MIKRLSTSTLRQITRMPEFGDIILPSEVFSSIAISCKDAVELQSKFISSQLNGAEAFKLLMHAADLGHEHTDGCIAFDGKLQERVRSGLGLCPDL